MVGAGEPVSARPRPRENCAKFDPASDGFIEIMLVVLAGTVTLSASAPRDLKLSDPESPRACTRTLITAAGVMPAHRHRREDAKTAQPASDGCIELMLEVVSSRRSTTSLPQLLGRL